MSKFYPLKVLAVNRETPEAVAIELEIPADHREEFKYKQGQYLTFKFNFKGEEIRRSYSLCSSPSSDKNLMVAVKEVEKGLASTFLNRELIAGDVLESMPPMGNFYTDLASGNKNKYVGIAAGSGITPLLSIIKETLIREPESSFLLIYANRSVAATIFRKELDELAEKNAERFSIVYLYSREKIGEPLHQGRPDKNKIKGILDAKNAYDAQHYFVCGPEEVIMNTNEILQEKGIKKESIHFELFTTPVKMGEGQKAEEGDFSGDSKVKVIIDGIETEFVLSSSGMSVLDAAIEAGADAPFSCKGAVCCTCKAKVISGKAAMDMNYALTDKEVEQGYVLSCQSHPRSPELIVDFDVA